MKAKVKEILIDLLFFTVGSACAAVSVSCFTAPNEIAAGGLTGTATILNHLFSLPIGIMIMVMNIPIFIIGLKKLGLRFLYKTIIATVMMSIFIDVASAFLPEYQGDRLLASIYGGVLTGLGLSLVFLRGSTTGGVDIIAKLVNLKYPHLSMGKIILGLDFIVIIAAALAYWNIENALYAMIAIFASSRLIDSIIYGADKGKVLLINSKKHEQIADQIMSEMSRGVTVLDGSGAYTKSQNKIILCAVRKQEAAKLHKIVREVDSKAFVVTFDAGEILGEGFKTI